MCRSTNTVESLPSKRQSGSPTTHLTPVVFYDWLSCAGQYVVSNSGVWTSGRRIRFKNQIIRIADGECQKSGKATDANALLFTLVTLNSAFKVLSCFFLCLYDFNNKIHVQTNTESVQCLSKKQPRPIIIKLM